MVWLYLLFALIAGALIPVQSGVNAQLARRMPSPAQTALVSFSVGTLALCAYCLVRREGWPQTGALAQAPWWAWVGGVLGALFVTAATILAPRLGALTLLGASLAGQLLISLALDHYGLIGFPVHPLNAWRVVGVGCVGVGVVLIRMF